jgi:hypothetical protein
MHVNDRRRDAVRTYRYQLPGRVGLWAAGVDVGVLLAGAMRRRADGGASSGGPNEPIEPLGGVSRCEMLSAECVAK